LIAFIFSILTFLLWVLFFFSSFLLVVLVLLQESKGGGLAEAFGGTGAETFGVRAGGINRFTFILAGTFILSAVFIHPVGRLASGSVAKLPDKAAAQPGQPGMPGGIPSPGGAPSPGGTPKQTKPLPNPKSSSDK